MVRQRTEGDSVRVGQGFDAHRLEAGRPLILAGTHIDHHSGLVGHSDGDVVLHALTSAILGAAGLGDLGSHFPSSDESLRGISSDALLAKAIDMVSAKHLGIQNADVTLIAEAPRLAGYRMKMQDQIARLLGIGTDRANLKITSTDGLGAIGKAEGIAALAVVLLKDEEL